jgi:cell wall assembly regulator SMI1
VEPGSANGALRTVRFLLAGVLIVGLSVVVMLLVDSNRRARSHGVAPIGPDGRRVFDDTRPVADQLPSFPVGKPLAADRNLQRTLDALDGLIRRDYPELYARFRPGLSQAEIDRLQQRLAPYHLPEELVTVYRWHDGWDDGEDSGRAFRALFPDDRFNSLSRAIDERKGWLSIGMDAWNPLWFPAFGSEYGQMVPLQSAPGRPAGQVYSFDAESDLGTSFDSLGSYFGTMLEYWRSGVMRRYDAGNIPAALGDEMRRIDLRHNPGSRDEHGLQAREISRASTEDWPAAWKEAVGVTTPTPATEDELMTVDQFRDDPSSGGPIRVELRPLGGAGDDTFAEAVDDTGTLVIAVLGKDTENAREVVGKSRTFDLWLKPVDPAYSREIEESFARFGTPMQLEYVATRIVPVGQ